jgi:hypothetical protein
MRRFGLPCIGLVVVAAGAIAMADAVKSGLAVGDHAGAFNVKDITGPNKGKSLCYR